MLETILWGLLFGLFVACLPALGPLLVLAMAVCNDLASTLEKKFGVPFLVCYFVAVFPMFVLGFLVFVLVFWP